MYLFPAVRNTGFQLVIKSYPVAVLGFLHLSTIFVVNSCNIGFLLRLTLGLNPV
jgi:hypothetical protein